MNIQKYNKFCYELFVSYVYNFEFPAKKKKKKIEGFWALFLKTFVLSHNKNDIGIEIKNASINMKYFGSFSRFLQF